MSLKGTTPEREEAVRQVCIRFPQPDSWMFFYRDDFRIEVPCEFIVDMQMEINQLKAQLAEVFVG